MSDLDKIQGTLDGMLSGVGATNITSQLKRTLRRYEVRTRLAGAASNALTNAATLSGNVTLGGFLTRVPVAVKVVAAYAMTDGANTTTDASNVRTIALNKRAGSAFGDAAVLVGSINTTATPLLQYVPIGMTLVAAQTTIAANSVLFVNSTEAAAGPACGACEVVVTLEEV